MRRVLVYGDKGEPVYETPGDLSVSRSPNDCVYILWDSENSHYHLIINIQAFLSNGDSNYRYCAPCMKMVANSSTTHHHLTVSCAR